MAENAATKERKKVVHHRPNPVFRKNTLRKMSPVTRQLARLIGEQASVTKRLKNLLPKIKEMELKDIERNKEVRAVLARTQGSD